MKIVVIGALFVAAARTGELAALERLLAERASGVPVAAAA